MAPLALQGLPESLLQGFVFRVSDFVFRVSGFGCRVSVIRCAVSTCGPVSPYSGRDNVKSLKPSYTGLYPQRHLQVGRGSALLLPVFLLPRGARGRVHTEPRLPRRLLPFPTPSPLVSHTVSIRLPHRLCPTLTSCPLVSLISAPPPICTILVNSGFLFLLSWRTPPPPRLRTPPIPTPTPTGL